MSEREATMQGPKERTLIRRGQWAVKWSSYGGEWRWIRTYNDPQPRTYGVILGHLALWWPRRRRPR